MREAEVILTRIAQRESYGKEYRRLKKANELKPNSSIITLTPFIDSKAKCIRVGGRLGYCNFPTDIKHPILLPSNHHVNKLIVQQAHLSLRHTTAERTLVAVHKKYWIPRGRASVNSIIKNCLDCKRFRAKPDIPMMSLLPVNRLQDDRPAFSNTGIDYFGPVPTTVARRTEKRWGIIFTCLVSRAVYLEMAYSLDTSSFLMAFWTFARRRIRPDVVYSDTGTNLTAGEKELVARLERLNQTIIATELGAQTIEWTSPPSLPPISAERGKASIKQPRTRFVSFFKITRFRTKSLSHLYSRWSLSSTTVPLADAPQIQTTRPFLRLIIFFCPELTLASRPMLSTSPAQPPAKDGETFK